MDADTPVSILGKPEDRERLASRAALVDRLAGAGVRRAPAERFADLLKSAAGALSGSGPVIGLIAPGRIEVLGKHTDYCGGPSLLAAVELGICFVAEPRADRRVVIHDVTLDRQAEFELSAGLEPPVGQWLNYPMTVAGRMARNFPGELCGANVAIASNLPPAAGMSSSSALVTGFFLVLAAINRLEGHPLWEECLATREQLAGYCGCIENGQSFGPLIGDRGVGTFGGSEDHTAILCALPGQLVQYSFCPIRREAVVPMPEAHTFVIMDSGIVAEKTGAAMEQYNSISRRAREVLRLWNVSQMRSDATLADAIRSRPDAVESFRQRRDADPALIARLQHYAFERSWVAYGAESLKMGDRTGFRVAVEHSQSFAEQLLGNQVPATTALAKGARNCGAVAASSFGAGFGGSVWAMVEEPSAGEFAERWLQSYAQIGGRGRAFVTSAGAGLVWV